jgi:redox-sensing transcriptional repressor
MVKSSRKLPPTVVKRLTRYLAHTRSLSEEDIEWVSSQEIADALGLTSSTVRQDLSHVDFSGISKRGYETCGLQRILESVLGADRTWNLVVVGAGNLGRALTLHEDFARHGFRIVGVFDNDTGRIGERIGDLAVQDTGQLETVVRSNDVELGVIAVPSDAAQAVADLLVKCGVHGLLNMSQTHVLTRPDVRIVDARIVASLQELAHLISSV